jgi:hypothetical protein
MVRVPLNEDCWLGINGVDPKYSGETYRSAIAGYVAVLHQLGIYAVLDLHFAAPGTTKSTKQDEKTWPMADADHAPDFWRSVAGRFKSDPAVVFDLFNEPWGPPANHNGEGIDWPCWQNGCVAAGYKIAGMQQLLDAVRGTGATQPVMLGGLEDANDMGGWLAHEPNDPLHQIVASYHQYAGSPDDTTYCWHQSCWDAVLGPIAARVPVVTGEMGEFDCAHGFIDGYMAWADAHGIGYLGWDWEANINAGDDLDCAKSPILISDYNGTPNNYGIGLRNHLRSLPPTRSAG